MYKDRIRLYLYVTRVVYLYRVDQIGMSMIVYACTAVRHIRSDITLWERYMNIHGSPRKA